MAYKWEINGQETKINQLTYLEINNAYSVAFYVNGIKQEVGYILNNSVLGINFDTNSKLITISDYSPTNVEFTIIYSYNDIVSELKLSTKYTPDFKGIDSIVNEDILGFEWTKTKNLVQFSYVLTINGEDITYIVDTMNADVGTTSIRDITSEVASFNEEISTVSIRINEIIIQTSRGERKHEFNSFATTNTAFCSGKGTVNDPYIISSSRHFANLGLSNSRSNYYRITNNINIEGNAVEKFYGVVYSDKLVKIIWTPTQSVKTGIILYNHGTIRNIQVNITKSFHVSGMTPSTIGGLVCYNESDGVIKNCSVENFQADRLNFMSTAGGIAGVNKGKIENCWAYAEATTYGTFGVIAGVNSGKVFGCCGMGNIIQKVATYEGGYELSSVGGVAGFNSGAISDSVGGTREDSYLKVTIDVPYVSAVQLKPYSGPIAGQNKGAITDCSNRGYTIDTGNLHDNQLENINNII